MRFLKWSGLGLLAVAAAVLAARWAQQLSRNVDRGLAQAEAIAGDTRQALEKTADAVARTEEALHAARRPTSS